MPDPLTHYLPPRFAVVPRKGHRPRTLEPVDGWTEDASAVTCPVCLERLERLDGRPEGVPPGQTPGL